MNETTQIPVKDDTTLLKKKGLNVNAPNFSCSKVVPTFHSISQQSDEDGLSLSELRISNETFGESFNK